MFRVKICGITNRHDAQIAVEAGADALGFNFYARTPRYVPPATARDIRRDLPSGVVCVGVFVNAKPDEVAAMAEAVGIDALQFHGDESPAALAAVRAQSGRVATLPLIRAFRCRDNDYAQMAQYVEECRRLGAPLDAALVDAYVEGKYGGGGESIDWEQFRHNRAIFGDLPVILAGGLTPENVATAIAIAGPDGVDVASGVEVAPGRKEKEALRRFVRQARNAWAGTAG